MKKFLPWLKSNLISVISVTLAVLLAPVAIFFSGQWSSKIRMGVESEVASFVQQMDGSDVTYQIDPYFSGQTPISVRSAPNEATTNAVASLLQAVVSGSDQVRQSAIDLNRADKRLLIEGATPEQSLFPENKDDSARLRLLDQFVDRWPKAHTELLAEFRGGSAPDPARIRDALQALRNDRVEALTTGGKESDLTAEQFAQLQEQMGLARLNLYRSEASNIAFYVNPSVFAAVQPWDRTRVMPMETAWEWQHIYWVHRDLIRALAAANADPVGAWRPVYLGPVKLVESITLSKPGDRAGSSSQRGGPGEDGGGSGGGPTDGAAEVQRNFTTSHTGRAATPVAANPLYDIRYADIVAIVSASRLPQVLAAFPRINFMTVIDVDLEEYDPIPALGAGHDFGSEHLVRATIRVETIWLRSWMKQWMPPTVRKSLGIPEEAPPPADAASTG